MIDNIFVDSSHSLDLNKFKQIMFEKPKGFEVQSPLSGGDRGAGLKKLKFTFP